MDASALGFEKGVTPLLGLPATLALPLRVPGIPEATLSTGAAVVSGTGYDRIAQDMVDMETYACLRACHVFGVPMIGLRGISDGAADLNHIGDWTALLPLIDEKLAEAVTMLEDALESGAIAL
jgi:adenosylhomocysteine nucleosidase